MSKFENKQKGRVGEKLALKYLKKQGYKILHTNYTTKIGEIDIIAKEGDTFVFVEVKNRLSDAFGLGRESVTPQKQNKIRQVATLFLKQTKNLSSKARCDVIEIQQDAIDHLKNAF